MEQFTEIVLAQERLDKDDVPITVDEVGDKKTDVTIQNKTLPFPQTTAKLKPVVLTPRHVPAHVSIPHPVAKPSSPGSKITTQSMREQMRRQLEMVIKKNEEILESSNVTNAPQRRGRAVTAAMASAAASQQQQHLDVAKPVDLSKTKPSAPLNLSVRKDLMKAKSDTEVVNVALERLLARHGNDLEITRKSKKDKNIMNFSPTPIASTACLLPRNENETRHLKRSLTNNNFLETKKSKIEHDRDNDKVSVAKEKDLTTLSDPSNKDKVKKILEDCKIALQQDLNGNW